MVSRGRAAHLLVNVAVTDFAPVIDTLHCFELPLQARDQPVKVDLFAGVAVSVTSVPAAKECEQVAPQSMPTGLDITRPLPLPIFVTLSVYPVAVNVAVTDSPRHRHLALLELPLQAPDQPVKVDLFAGVAVSVTSVPAAKECEQVVPQSMPTGLDVTRPLPLPIFVTLSVYPVAVNVAVTDFAPVIDTLHCFELPLQAPDQPVKVDLFAGVAVSVTSVPAAKECEQVVPQLMPSGSTSPGRCRCRSS